MKSFLFERVWSCTFIYNMRRSRAKLRATRCVRVCVQCIVIIMYYNLLRIEIHWVQNFIQYYMYASIHGWAAMLMIKFNGFLFKKKEKSSTPSCSKTVASAFVRITFMVHIVHSMFLGYSYGFLFKYLCKYWVFEQKVNCGKLQLHKNENKEK